MQQRSLFLFGALAGVIFFSAIYILATMVDGYSHIAQTISEIGEIGSPAEVHLRVMNLVVALCLLVFAWSLHLFAKSNSASNLPAIFIACYSISEIGMAMFPSPHALHNVFGLSMTIGYMSPLVLALSWKNLASANGLIMISWTAFIFVVITIFLNLTPVFARDLYPLEYYGIVQRSLFVAFFGWCVFVSVKLFVSR